MLQTLHVRHNDLVETHLFKKEPLNDSY